MRWFLGGLAASRDRLLWPWPRVPRSLHASVGSRRMGQRAVSRPHTAFGRDRPGRDSSCDSRRPQTPSSGGAPRSIPFSMRRGGDPASRPCGSAGASRFAARPIGLPVMQGEKRLGETPLDLRLNPEDLGGLRLQTPYGAVPVPSESLSGRWPMDVAGRSFDGCRCAPAGKVPAAPAG